MGKLLTESCIMTESYFFIICSANNKKAGFLLHYNPLTCQSFTTVQHLQKIWQTFVS